MDDTARNTFVYVLLAAMLLCVIAALVGLVSPRTVRMKSRPGAFFLYLFLGFLCMMGIGFVAPPVVPGEGAVSDSVSTVVAPALAGADSGPAAPEPEEPATVLRSDSGSIRVSSSRKRWDAPMLVAQLPPGTEVVLLRRELAGQVARCEVRTTFEPRVTGWVHCASVRSDGGP
jgi:hypothetical protein